MRLIRKTLKLAPMAALLAASSAMATDGYFSHGYGMTAKGMGGVATALADDAFGGANNPASMVWVGSRFDLGVDWFRPIRSSERSGAGFSTLNGHVDSNSDNFAIPEFGYNRLVRSDMSLGISVYGNGGMNTNYPQGTFNCGGPSANMLCGSGNLGVNLTQLIIAPTLSVKLNPQHSVGVSVLLGYQRFSAYGLQAFDNAPGFPPFTGTPGSVTNQGVDDATGAGLRIGYLGHLNETVTVGASYSSKIYMSKFKKYAGLFANGGAFDIPSNFSLGVALTPNAAWTVALDFERINYSGVASVGNPSTPVAPLGASNGPGFGWTDINVFKLGAAWRMNDNLTLRAGYNRGDNPIRSADVTFNILAPGVITNHYTAGFTLATSKENEFTGALMVAPRQSVSGSSLFNNVLGAGAAGTETISMREMSLGLAWSRKF